MPLALVALGANLGDRQAALAGAHQALRADPHVRLLETSPTFETAPVGGPAGQAPFLNAALTLETRLEPHALWARLQAIETQHGRTRHKRWDARTLDLDLLLIDQLVLSGGPLVLPHPRMAVRAFVLEPAATVAATWLHPTAGQTVGQLWRHLQENSPWVALWGPSAWVRQVARGAADRLGTHSVADPWSTGQATFGERLANAIECDRLRRARVRRELQTLPETLWLAEFALPPVDAARLPLEDRLAPLFTACCRTAAGTTWSDDCQFGAVPGLPGEHCPRGVTLELPENDLPAAIDELVAGVLATRRWPPGSGNSPSTQP